MKKFMKHLAVAIATILAITSCNEEKKKQLLLPNITGKAGEIIVVIDKGQWEGVVGTTLRDSLTAEMPFLPQPEPLFSLVNVPRNAFNTMFQVHRNILIVNVDSSVTEPGMVLKKDLWAAPQTVVYINATDSESAAKIIEENSAILVTAIEQAEIDRTIRNIKKYSEPKISTAITEMVGGSPHFPTGYKLKKKTSDFIWAEYATQGVTQGVLVYKYPVVEGEDMMSPESIIDNSNEMLKNNVPGVFENTYMTISNALRPGIEYKRYKGLAFAEIRGFWEVYNDYMGGPFVSHVFYSQDGKEIIVLQAFVYAPKFDKRQYLRQAESVIYSFEWAKNEKEDEKN